MCLRERSLNSGKLTGDVLSAREAGCGRGVAASGGRSLL